MFATLLTSIIPGLIDKIFPDPKVAADAKLRMLELQQSGELAQLKAETDLALGQLAINAEEAKSASVFVSGWRPMVGWCGAIALAYAAIIEPVARFVAQVWFGYTGAFPVIDTTLTMQILFGILGLGAYRSFEKSKGVASK